MKKKGLFFASVLIATMIFVASSSFTPAMAFSMATELTGECTGPQCEPANGLNYTTAHPFLQQKVCCGKFTTDDIGSQDSSLIE